MLPGPVRPRVSRETRRLLAAAGLALVALWVLARVRFPDRPINAVSPVLTQISPPATFDDLSGEVEAARRLIAPTLAYVTWRPSAGADADTRTFAAWPLGDRLGLTMLPRAAGETSGTEIRFVDPPTGLAVIRVDNPVAAALSAWVPDRPEEPRYFFAVAPAASQPAITPFFVSGLEPWASPAWPEEIWRVPPPSPAPAGALLFTPRGEWVGIAGVEDGAAVIIPAQALLDRAQQMHAPPGSTAGDPGIQVQPVPHTVATATGVDAGVVVTFVDSAGVLAKSVSVGDVIERINNQAVSTPFGWQVRWTRLSAGAPVTLRVRGKGGQRDVALTVPAADVAPEDILGLTLVRAAAGGARVTGVEPSSVAARAGLRPDDVITLIGDVTAPTPMQVRRAFDAIAEGGVLMVIVTRDATHRVLSLTR